MNWLTFAFIAPVLWALSNHIDKYLLGKYLQGVGVGALIVFSSLIGFFVLPIIWWIEPNSIYTKAAL